MGGGLLDTLTAALDDLADVDVDSLDDDTLHGAVVGLGALSTRLEAQWCRLIVRWDGRQIWADNGSKAAGARLARETHRRRGDADRLVRRARDLAAMPHTEKAYAAGRSTAPTSIWSPRATGSGAMPTSRKARSSSSTCGHRSSGSPTGASSTGSSGPITPPPSSRWRCARRRPRSTVCDPGRCRP